MPSVTYWTRLESRSRSHDFVDALATRIRDPLWFLTRQWQLGEFQGEDAASPACVQVDSKTSPVFGWRPRGQPTQATDPQRPLEAQAQAEPFFENLTVSVELGQAFEALLDQAGLSALKQAFRSAFPLTLPSGADEKSKRFFSLFSSKVTDGAALYFAIQQGGAIPGGAQAVLPSFQTWAEDLCGVMQPKSNEAEAPTWKQERLEYDLEVLASAEQGAPSQVLTAHPDHLGELEWYSFDLQTSGEPKPGVNVPQVQTQSLVVQPMHVRFKGMPAPRWWDFENGQMDFGDMTVDRVDSGRLIFMDFMLIHGVDWFMIPFSQPVGSLSEVTGLTVLDVFGDKTTISRADELHGELEDRWTMFTTSVEGDDTVLGKALMIPPSCPIAAQIGEDLEEVRFFRDDIADMAWAVEHTIENTLGQPKAGHEEHQENHPPTNADGSRPLPTVPTGVPVVRYQIQSEVPDNWFPLLPKVVDPNSGLYVLQQGEVALNIQQKVAPKSRILEIHGNAINQIEEQEVPRSGVKVSRAIYRTRWTDGSTHLWMARKKKIGEGEGSSGIRFDQAAPNE